MARRFIPVLSRPQLISGITKNNLGNPLGGCTVKLFDTSSDVLKEVVVSDAAGAFTFSAINDGAMYYTVDYKRVKSLTPVFLGQQLSHYASTFGTAIDDTVIYYTGPSATKFSGTPGVAAGAFTASGVLADTGRRLTFRHRVSALPAAQSVILGFYDASFSLVWALSMKTDGTLIESLGAAGPTALLSNTWNRISVSYTISSATVFRFDVYANGVLQFSATSGTLPVGSSKLALIVAQAAGTTDGWFDDVYVDALAGYADPVDDVAGTSVNTLVGV